MWDGDDFAVAEADEALAQTGFRFVMWQARGSLSGRGQARRKLVETIDASDFLDQINFALDFGAPGRLCAFPCGEQRAFGAAILVHANGSETQRAKAGFDLLVRDVRAHDAEKLFTSDLNFLWRTLAGVNIHDASEQLATRKLKDQFGAPARSQFGHFRISAAAKARGRFGMQFQKAGGAANGD
ncbi:MAG TPA: hypothetical protein VI216_15955, partial [Candidatus Acidoferrales bacterium]